MIPRSVPYEHNPPPRDNIVTVFMPGITSCRSQISRYTGGDMLTVLCNWSDVDPADPLHLADAGRNRFSGMPLGRRLRRVWRHWRSAVFGLTRHSPDSGEEDDDQDDVDDGAASVVRRVSSHRPSVVGGGAPSPSTAVGPARPSVLRTESDAVRAAKLGLSDPPVLYSATCRIAPRLLHGVLASPEVSEIRHRGWWRTWNPFHWALTAKELLTCWWFSVRPFQWCYSEPGRTNSGGLRDQADFTREVRRGVRHLGDHADTTSTAAASATTTAVPRKKHLVLFGVSRGATTCFYAAMKLPPEEARHVSLVLVEAPFDTLEHVIEASCWTPRLMRWFARSFSDWRGTREEKLAYDFDATQVHLRCPIAFVMSLKDRRVPMECTQALIDRVRRELVPHVIPAVEVLVLRHSRHPAMAVSNKEDQDAYVEFVERLYDTYCSA
ncbi:hypothetical protein NESM_000389700 [Novymonas esmeraldas]|uniref:Uncharacterized protein n=1 Tax=Novymonas esmeraldas TaxID=1808958 RepID=A0AAW0EPC8_9TRYP